MSSKKFYLLSLLLLAVLYFVYYISNIFHLGFSHYINIFVNIMIPVVLISYIRYKWNNK